MLKKIAPILLLTAVNCAQLERPETIGAISGAGVVKVKEDLKAISTLPPYLNIPPLEVCYRVKGHLTFHCILTPCKEDCSRQVEMIDYNEAVFIPETMWLKFSGEIKALCLSEQENFREVCKMKWSTYPKVIGVFNEIKN